MKRFNLIILLFLCSISYSQDTLTLREIEEIEKTLIEYKTSGTIIFVIGTTSTIIAILNYNNKKTFRYYLSIGLLFDIITIFQIINIKKQEKRINEIYSKMKNENNS